MAAIKILGDAMVITSTMKFEDIKFAEKHDNGSLVLLAGEEAVPVFRSMTGKNAGVFGESGIVFTGQNAEGFATTTVALPSGTSVTEKKELLRDKYLLGIQRINSLEELANAGIITTREQMANVMAKIKFLD